MNLVLELKLDQPRCVQGESVSFSVTLTNIGGQPVRDLPTFHPFNRALFLIARPERALSVIGLELGAKIREFNAPSLVHWHPRTIELQPQASITVHGDVLYWIGELPAGDYTLAAEYHPGQNLSPLPIRSTGVKLTISRALPSEVRVPRVPEMSPVTPVTPLWRHGKPEDRVWFFQEQSRVLPPNPYHALRITDIPANVEPEPSIVPTPQPAFAHIVWTLPGKLGGMRIPADGPGKPSPLNAPLPFSKGELLRSPRTTDENGLWVVAASEAGDQLAFVDQKETGPARVTALPLQTAGPFGLYSLNWTLENRLELGWSRRETRDLFYASLAPSDPAASFAPRPVGVASAALLAVDLWCDTAPPTTSGAGLIELTSGVPVPLGPKPGTQAAPPGPDIRLFTLGVEPAPARLVFARWRIPGGNEEVFGRVSIPEGVKGGLSVVQAAVTARKEFVYLVKDEAERVYFASTQFEELTPLEALVGQPVPLEQQPRLLTASQELEQPWVYLRHAPPEATGFVFTVLEPRGAASPYRLLNESMVRR